MDFERSIRNLGCAAALQRAFARGKAGEKLTIGFIGGSITQGSLASSADHCYAALVYRWFEDRFPKVRYVNAGVGGTTSQFGAARVREDLLVDNPDIVFVEFSVNDEATDHFQECYEGLIRTLLTAGTAVILIHNVFYDTGCSAEYIHFAIGQHYHLPCLSVRESIWQEVMAGRIPVRDITPDDLHPNDRGHELLAEMIIHFLTRVGELPVQEPVPIPAPITPNHYERSYRCREGSCAPILAGFLPDDRPQTDITQMFRRGYIGAKQGDRIIFLVEGTCLAVQYRKSVRHPAPIAVIIVDDDEGDAVILDGNFQKNWGDCLYTETILEHAPCKMRKVEIRITHSSDEDAVPFYLAALLVSPGP